MPAPTYEEATARSVRTLTTLVVILGVFLGLTLAVAAYAVVDVTGAISRITAVASAQGVDAHRAKAVADQLAADRNESILRACEQQNERHTRTIRELDRILHRAERVAPPLRRAQIQESRASTVLLIDQLAPYENCQQQVRLADQPTR